MKLPPCDTPRIVIVDGGVAGLLLAALLWAAERINALVQPKIRLT
jgi:hypothetical protein